MTDVIESHSDMHAQMAERHEKLDVLRKNGIAYPNTFKREHLSANLLEAYANRSEAELEADPTVVSVAGRVMLRRSMGKASFIHVQDMLGRIQIYIRSDVVGAETYEDFKTWDIGDIVGINGVLFRTKTGELSIKARSAQLLTKSLRPLPDKFHGLADQETRYRRRYLDLLMNEDTRRVFRIRMQLIDGIRRFLQAHGFLEVETPMMQVLPGGAIAKPFVTHHNALDIPLYLRIAPELYLKRLVVGGYERVFEINRNFRNEGLSTRHNPEFTMVEFYQAYADYQDLMDLTEILFRTLGKEVLGSAELGVGDQVYDLNQAFARMTLKESVLHYNRDIAPASLESLSEASTIADRLNIAVPSAAGLGKIQAALFEKTVEHQLQAPTFITAYPAEVSPLARANDQDPFITDRFELFVGGREIANGFSELNDPEDQAERFKSQVSEKNAGDAEAMHFDEDYIMALEYGLPPTAGEGIGIDRLAMLFANVNTIREVILFPHLRPESS